MLQTIKFIIVIMSVVTVLFVLIFGFIMTMTTKNIERESIQMMRTISMYPQTEISFRKPDNVPDNIRLPFFTVIVSKDGEPKIYGNEFFDIDEETLRKLIDIVFSSRQMTGVISEYDLRFMKNENMNTVVFADISSESAIIKNLIKNSLIIGFIGYAVIFVISILLAIWVTRPVEKTWKEQKQFIADASHELKTPLTVIMTNAEMLTYSDYSEKDRENFINNILSMSKRMRGLVENLLELARMDNRTVPIKKEKSRLAYSTYFSLIKPKSTVNMHILEI